MKRHLINLPSIDIGKVSFRFWQKIQPLCNSSCLEWIGGRDKDGYGKFTIFHSTFRASRVAFFLYYGIDPGELLVLHRCDNPKCVNPRHLKLGTQSDNIRDMDTKNRRGFIDTHGEKSGRAILCEQDVVNIRNSSKTTIQLARDYGVHYQTILHARRGLSWSHLCIK
jgi:hypothetical protein